MILLSVGWISLLELLHEQLDQREPRSSCSRYRYNISWYNILADLKITALTWMHCFQESYILEAPQCPSCAQTPAAALLPEEPQSNSGDVFMSPELPLSFRLQNCNLTSASCETLRSVLSAQPSLTELHVGDNKLGTAGVKVLCQGLMNPNCKLQKLQ